MKTLLISTALIALLSGTPASAQLLGGGGGLGGGVGGQLGGAGGVGGLGGSLGGNVNGTLGSTRIVSDAAAQARDDARRADRTARREANRVRKESARANPNGSASFTGTSAIGTQPLNAAGSASGMTSGNIAGRTVNGNGNANAALGTRTNLDAPGVRTRGIVAATNRGMRRVAQTASGVPVFVAAQAAAPARLASRSFVTPYPVYSQTAYYGGGDTVFLSSGEVGGYMDRYYDDLRGDLRGTGATLTRRGNDLVLELPADVTFAYDKADIQPRFYGTLSAVANTLQDYRATDVEIIGHTDSIGSDDYNLGLSERRGRSVADFLVQRAADPSRLVVEGMGKSEPVASNATISGRAANRRVEIVFHPRTAG